MTKRKMLAMIIALTLSFSLCACEQEYEVEESPKVPFEKFVVLEKGYVENSYMDQFIMYDPDTLVMYTYFEGYDGGGLTVMYNADGTLRTYSPEG